MANKTDLKQRRHYRFKPLSAGTIFRRQILILKSIPEIEQFIIAVDPQHGNSNEAERTNKDIHGDFKLKMTLCSPC